jgi:Flp pilus assembly protein TadB
MASATILAAVAAAGALLVAFGLARGLRRRANLLVDWLNPARPAEPRRRPGAGPRARAPLPRWLGYLEGRMKAAGVDWPAGQLLRLIAGGALAAALLGWLATGIPWIAALCSLGGLYVPVWRLSAMAQQRAAAVAGQLDQVCSQLIQALSGGLDLHEAIRRQAERAPDPTGAELRRAMDRSRSGEAFTTAIREFGDRIDLDEARLFAAGVRLAMEEGARPVPVLESVLRSLRGRREIRGLAGELSAQSRTQSVVLVVIPLLMFPAMRLVAPAFTAPLFGTAAGQMLLAIDLAWMLFGLRLARNWLGGVNL